MKIKKKKKSYIASAVAITITVLIVVLTVIIVWIILGNNQSCDTSSTSGGDATLVNATGDNAKDVYNFWIAQKFTPAAAASVVGNVTQESQLDSSASNGQYWGIYQAPESKIKAFAAKKGKSATDVILQSEFMYEGSGSGGYGVSDKSKLLKLLRSTKEISGENGGAFMWWSDVEIGNSDSVPSLYDYQQNFMSNTWQGGNGHGTTRVSAAEAAYKKFASSTPATGALGDAEAGADINASSNQAATNSGCSAVSGNGQTSPYVFDKDEKGIILTAGINDPNHGGQHDGWDINPIAHPSDPVGQGIYSVTSGQVIGMSEGDGVSQMPYVTVKNNDMIVQYQEFKISSVPSNIQVGSNIEAGAQVGSMGSMAKDGNPYVTLHSASGGVIAISMGNHLHISSYKPTATGANGNVAHWGATAQSNDPGSAIFGLKDGLTSVSGQTTWTWDKLKSSDAEKK